MKKARLDYFLMSKQLLCTVHKCGIHGRYKSDHAIIGLSLDLNQSVRGKSYWKLNTKLLEDEELKILIRKEIAWIKATYACTPYEPDYVFQCPSKDLIITIDETLFWETMLAQIRGIIISYAIKKKKRDNKQEEELNIKLDQLEQICNQKHPNPQKLRELEEVNKKLISLREDKIRGVMTRSRAQWLEYGEKPTPYFFSLENSNYIDKTIKEIEKTPDHVITKQEEILEEVKTFYKDLYTERPRNQTLVESLENLKIPCIPKLPTEDSNLLRGEITIEELKRALLNTKNNKSPGLDGFPVEFFKTFWDELGSFMLRSINNSYKQGSLPASQKEGLITCIPKGDKPRKFLKNWRPISLLNSSYKLISTCIANRIKNVLDIIIAKEQKGFVKGRNISENTVFLHDLMFYLEENELPGMLLLIDFEKAFDSVAWDFILLCLEKFGFPENIIKWVRMFQEGSVSRVIQNGHLSDFFSLERGCRQGDPISPYLFIICAEILGLAIKASRKVKGIYVHDNENKIGQFADDTSLYLDGSEKSLKASLEVLANFEETSGLKLNIQKTKAIWLGSKRFSQEKLCAGQELDWVKNFTSLGINYDVLNLADITKLNCDTKMMEIENLLRNWNRRNISLFGRIQVIKSLALSKIVHFLIALPTPEKDYMRRIDKRFYRFLWRSKPPKIKKKVLEMDYCKGGLKMVNIFTFEKSLKIKWVRQLNSKHDAWTIIPTKYKIHCLMEYGNKFPNNLLHTVNNPFWRSVVESFAYFQELCCSDPDLTILSEPIWFNDPIKIGYIKLWDQKGLKCVGDLFNLRGELRTRQDIQNSFDIRMNFLDYHRLVKAIPEDWTTQIKENPGDNMSQSPWCPTFTRKVLANTKDNPVFKKYMLSYNTITPTAESSWENHVLLPDNEDFWPSVYLIPHNLIKDVNQKIFQYKILHRLTATNRKLKICGIKQTDTCDRCKEEIETITHLFCDCSGNNNIWKDIIDWFNSLGYRLAYLTDVQILFGDPKLDPILNKIIIACKYQIFKAKAKKNTICLKKLLYYLKSESNYEKSIAVCNNQQKRFWGLWAPIWNHLKSI